MSKVLFLVNHEVVIYNFRLELIERLLADGHEVVISSPYGERIRSLIELGCRHDDVVIARHGLNPLKEISLLEHYKKLMRKERPTIVFSYTIKPNIYGAIAAGRNHIPFVANITGLGMATEGKGWMQWITRMMYRYAFRNIRTVYLQNEENLAYFKKYALTRGFRVDRKTGRNVEVCKLLPGSGVNLQRFDVQEYPMEDSRTHFAFISRIMYEKGADEYLRAAEVIRKRYPDTVFHVCGFCDGDYEEKLQRLHDEGVIIYHGMIRDVKSMLAQVHCVVHPSAYPEGLSNVLLESMACARPIITTDRAGCGELLADNVNGYLVKQHDADDLISVLEKFMNLSRAQQRDMGLAGRHIAESKYDRQIVVETYMDELRSVRG